MTRFNIFNLIHKALRAMLYDTALCMQQTNFADADDCAEAFAKMNEVIDAFEMHGHTEDSIVMPFIQQYHPALISSFEQEHLDDTKMGKDLRQLQMIYCSLHQLGERLIAGSAIVKSFRDYMIFNLQHMQREEVELNALLWEHFSDKEIVEINNHIIANMPPEKMVQSAQWFMKAINYQEALELLEGIKNTAPQPVFDALFQMTEVYLPERLKPKVQRHFTVRREVEVA